MLQSASCLCDITTDSQSITKIKIIVWFGFIYSFFILSFILAKIQVSFLNSNEIDLLLYFTCMFTCIKHENVKEVTSSLGVDIHSVAADKYRIVFHCCLWFMFYFG